MDNIFEFSDEIKNRWVFCDDSQSQIEGEKEHFYLFLITHRNSPCYLSTKKIDFSSIENENFANFIAEKNKKLPQSFLKKERTLFFNEAPEYVKSVGFKKIMQYGRFFEYQSDMITKRQGYLLWNFFIDGYGLRKESATGLIWNDDSVKVSPEKII